MSESTHISQSGNDDSNATISPISVHVPMLSLPTTSTKNNKKGRVKSEVWNWFEKIEENIGGEIVEKARCLHCNAKLTSGTKVGTSHLKKHIDAHAASEVQNQTFKKQMQIGKDVSGMLANFKWDKRVARKETVDFIIRAELPFSHVDTNDFKGWIQRAFIPQYTGMSAQTCKRDVMKRFSEKKTDLIKFFDMFDGKVSLTSDMWTSRKNLGYMSLTAHFIDKDWLMHKRILSFKMVAYPHTGEILGTEMFDEILAWHLNEKIFAVTLDNASNNDVLCNHVSDALMLPPISAQLFHNRCTCHVLNLIVQDGLSVLNQSISKITGIVKSMNSSPKRHEIYVNACLELGLPKKNIDNDVPHRWNSTHDLLSVALKYRAAIVRYASIMNENRHTQMVVPNNDDWFVAACMCNFLSVFSISTKTASGVYSPTSNRVLTCLCDIRIAFGMFDNVPQFVDALRLMRLKFNKYWADFPIVWTLATIVDPRFKLVAVEEFLRLYDFSPVDVQIKMESIRITLHALYDVYKRKFAASLSVPASSSHTSLPVSSSDIPCASDINELDGMLGFNIPVLANLSGERWKRARVGSSSSHSDLSTYLELRTIEDNPSFDILSWWKANASSYPVLSLMARDLLTVPASTVASEAAFSAGGRVVSDRRACLSPKTIEALVCCKDWALAETRMQEAAARAEADELLNESLSSRPEWLLDEDVSETENVDVLSDNESVIPTAASVTS